MADPQHFCFLLVEDFSHIAFSCAIEPLRIANLISGKALYRWSFAAADGRHAICSNRSITLADHDWDHLPRCDRLFVLSGIDVQKHTTKKLLDVVRRERAKGTRVGALCSAAWVLARAGLLDGYPAAIHWEFHDGFMEAFPEVNLIRSVFCADEPFVTASGGTATADLMLHLIEQRHGRDLSVAIADQMVYSAVRDATAEQRVSLQSRHGMRNPTLARAIAMMEQQLEEPVSPTAIASEVGVSPRQLERLFGRYLNCSPRKYYVDLRLQKAKNLLVQTDLSIREVGLACGFEDPGHFARVFRGRFGMSPKQHRTFIN